MIKRALMALAGLFLAVSVTADAQVVPFPQSLPANTVVGRTGISAGPSQAIPFSVLSSILTVPTLQISNFGAVCDGVTDDRAAIQLAITTAISQRKALYINPSANGCIVTQNGANSYALLADGPLQIIGVPGYSIIRPAAAMANTVEIIYFLGSTTINFAPTIVDGVFIGNPSSGTRTGHHGIVFDTLAAGATFFRPVVRNSYIQPVASGTGISIFAVNSAANNPGGGTAYAQFEHNHIGSGISLTKSGDSIKIEHNVFFGTTDAIYADLVTNAGNLQINHNNFGINARFANIDCSVSTQIDGNEIEHNNTGSAAEAINLNGGVCALGPTFITGNQIQALTGTGGTPTLIRVNSAAGAFIGGNRIATPTDYTPVTITASATGTVIGAGNTFLGMTTPVSNAGTLTIQATTVPFGSGGASQVVQRTTANGAFSVARLACADLSNAAASCSTDATNANNISSGALATARGGTGTDVGTGWSAYTPSISCGTGTLTTVSSAGASKQVGKIVFVRLNISITTNGTCATNLVATLPVAPVTSQEMVVPARDVTSAVASIGRITSAIGTSVTITKYDGTYPGASGANIVVTGVYEAN